MDYLSAGCTSIAGFNTMQQLRYAQLRGVDIRTTKSCLHNQVYTPKSYQRLINLNQRFIVFLRLRIKNRKPYCIGNLITGRCGFKATG